MKKTIKIVSIVATSIILGLIIYVLYFFHSNNNVFFETLSSFNIKLYSIENCPVDHQAEIERNYNFFKIRVDLNMDGIEPSYVPYNCNRCPFAE